MKKPLKIIGFATLMYFVSWVLVYITSVNHLAIQSEDTLPAMFLPVTIIKHGTLYADEYYQAIRHKYPHPDDKDFQLGLTPFYYRRVDGHYISAFPLMTGLLALPVYIGPLLYNMPISWYNLTALAHLTASLIVAISGAVLYILLKDHLLKNEKQALVLTGVYLFGTINFASISQSLWQHGTLQLFLLLSLLFLYQRRWAFSGLTMGAAVLSRPTAMVMFPFYILIMMHLLFDVRKKVSSLGLDRQKLLILLKYVSGILAAVIFFLWYTQTYYLGIENNGYASQFLVGWLSRFPEGFLGLWLSPSKGVLIYSPVFIFSIVGVILVLRGKNWKKKENFIYLVSAAMVLVHTLILGRWKHWYGGWSFGYRMASDILPFLIILLIPFVKSRLFHKYKGVFWVLIIISVLIEFYGMIFFDGIWHAAYDEGFSDTAWLWSIKDSEFVFNARRVLVKFRLLDKACPQC